MKNLILIVALGFLTFTLYAQTTAQETKKENVKTEQTPSKDKQTGTEKMSPCSKNADGKSCAATCKESKACTGMSKETKSCTCVCKDGKTCTGTCPDGKVCTCVCHEGKKCSGVCNDGKKSD